MAKADAASSGPNRPPAAAQTGTKKGKHDKGNAAKGKYDKGNAAKGKPKHHSPSSNDDKKKSFHNKSSNDPHRNKRSHSSEAGRRSSSSYGYPPKKSAAASASSNDPPAKRPRRHAEVVDETKRIWNDLRKKTNTPDDTRKLVDQLMPRIRGKAAQLALQHDASRVVQAAIQFGSPEERRSVLEELCQSHAELGAAAAATTPASSSSNNSNGSVLVELCKSQYGHFVVLKVLKYCSADGECADRIVKALRSHMPKLATHGIASRVVEHVFQKLPHRRTSVLKQELYGPHFALFAADTVREQGSSVPTLASNVLAAPDKRQATIEYVRTLVNKGAEKQLFGYAYFQDLLDEFLQVAPPEEIRSLAGTAAADSSIHMLSTRAGTRAVASLVAYGSAKDRKRVLKSLKGRVRPGILHRDAYLAILRLVQLTDDTVSIQKSVLQEILAPAAASASATAASTTTAKASATAPATDAPSSPLLELALSESASKLFLMLLADKDEVRNKFFDPYEHSVLFPNPSVTENGESVPTSKKDPDVRRRELLHPLRDPLVELCRRHPEQLMLSPAGGRVLVQVYSAFAASSSGGDGEDHGTSAMVQALVEACASSLTTSPDDGGSGDKQVQPLLEDRNGHLAIKNLILVDASANSGDGGNKSFAAQLFRRVSASGGGMLDVAASNRGAFVAAALCKVPSVRAAALEQVRSNRKKLESLSKGDGATAGYAALLNELQQGAE